ncbi:DUF4446 family protein [Clostridium sp. NSJ-49]|uniref:DUF4446 family protein n=1 Tax=Clostridium disporicum TaxID=84024 RepID=A0A174I5T5_9CLOT|nr:DUF4446 family protein [Clostridium disporicum]MBC5625213.1 DUF4446 family protein [Clostridium sp. NSJ-49]MCD2502721.1 DUF4446 family protein [Clostridium sp. NSJ-145]CUO80828.1 Uncharacterised protein [Clostridium disporicum]
MSNILNIINEYSGLIVIGLAIITLLLLITTIVLLLSVNKVEKKYRKMMRGTNSRNLEEVINSNLDNIDVALNNSKESLERCEKIAEDLKSCVNKVAIMRYKAFEDVGSDLSFSIAILDSYNDGVIITGIYSRHDSTTYAKPIDKGISRYDLSEEELHVLNEAINK